MRVTDSTIISINVTHFSPVLSPLEPNSPSSAYILTLVTDSNTLFSMVPCRNSHHSSGNAATLSCNGHSLTDLCSLFVAALHTRWPSSICIQSCLRKGDEGCPRITSLGKGNAGTTAATHAVCVCCNVLISQSVKRLYHPINGCLAN